MRGRVSGDLLAVGLGCRGGAIDLLLLEGTFEADEFLEVLDLGLASLEIRTVLGAARFDGLGRQERAPAGRFQPFVTLEVVDEILLLRLECGEALVFGIGIERGRDRGEEVGQSKERLLHGRETLRCRFPELAPGIGKSLHRARKPAPFGRRGPAHLFLKGGKNEALRFGTVARFLEALDHLLLGLAEGNTDPLQGGEALDRILEGLAELHRRCLEIAPEDGGQIGGLGEGRGEERSRDRAEGGQAGGRRLHRIVVDERGGGEAGGEGLDLALGEAGRVAGRLEDGAEAERDLLRFGGCGEEFTGPQGEAGNRRRRHETGGPEGGQRRAEGSQTIGETLEVVAQFYRGRSRGLEPERRRRPLGIEALDPRPHRIDPGLGDGEGIGKTRARIADRLEGAVAGGAQRLQLAAELVDTVGGEAEEKGPGQECGSGI